MPPDQRKEIILRGVPASPGVAQGPAFVFFRKELEIPSYHVESDRREEEISRFELALLETRRQISAIRAEIEEKLGEDEARIFDAHQLVLEDRALIEETVTEVFESGFNIEYCFHQVSSRYIEAFARIDDEYLKERVNDIRDVSRRVLHNLMGQGDALVGRLAEEKVIVADDLSPSDTAHFERGKVLAIVTDQGSRTSHAVIMARSADVPAVVGLHDATEKIEDGDILLVDGFDGLCIINPSPETLFRYGKIRIQRQTIRRLFETAVPLPCQSLDGEKLNILLNIEGHEDLEALRRSGAEGVGLFRTEGLFIRTDRFPSEEEQYQAYRRVVEGLNPWPIIIRTLDLGGDKRAVGGLLAFEEANPFMGFRAIRFCLEHTGVFMDQLRAILRASAHGKVRIMYPMISGINELIEANEVLQECKAELVRRGQPFDETAAVGSMIEIPSAAVAADHLAEKCDFFSIGTNDLIQYMLAVDRVNDRIAHLYEPCHPAVLRTIRKVIELAAQRKIPVSVCGEMAGDAIFAPLLFGFGADSLSVSPGVVPELKYLVRSMRLSEAREMGEEVLRCRRPQEVSSLLRAFYNRCIGPGIATM